MNSTRPAGKSDDPSAPQDEAREAARPSRDEALAAVRTLIRWAGDDPAREGLLGTPDRVARAFEQYFQGYAIDPVAILQRTFEETDGYDEIVLLRDIRFDSHCEHHIMPIIGRAHVGYLPDKRVVGISKLARVVDAYAKRLQIQEKMTAQIANTIDQVLEPQGVAVVIEATHQCMTTRGVHKPVSQKNIFGQGETELRKAVQEATDTKEIDRIEAIVVEVHKSASGKAVITLDNGQVWKQSDNSRARLSVNDKVTIRRRSFGS